MKISYHVDKDILYIEIDGRIDASNSDCAEAEMDEIRSNYADKYIVIDADKLEYISSAGLRVILKIRKSNPDMGIINVTPEVYDVLDMTGFTDMMKVVKAYKTLNVDGCEFIAKGANGAVYRYDSETIVKTYYNKDALPDIKQERENARKAFILGVNTAIPYGIVRVGDGYGTITELLDSPSLSKLIVEDKIEFDKAVDYYVNTLKQIHSIEVEEGEFPDFKDWLMDWVDILESHLPKEKVIKLRKLIDGLPKSKYLMHGDYHTNNVMIQNGEALLIDLDTLSVGCPILELGSMFNAYVGFSEMDHEIVKSFLGIDFDYAIKFWRASLAKYIDSTDERVINEVENKVKVMGYTRLLQRCIRINDTEEKIKHYTKQLCDVLDLVDTLEF